MPDVYYTKSEGGIVRRSTIDISQECQKKQCKAQALDTVNSRHKVTLSDGNVTINASAVFFLDGYIWDAVLSGYDTMKSYRYKRSYRRKKRLPKCTKLPYWRNL